MMFRVALALGLLAMPHAAFAALTEVSNEADLAPIDLVDWSQLGTAGTGLSTPVAWTSDAGATGFLGASGGLLERQDQGTDWFGNFADGDALIYQPFSESAQESSETITLSFDNGQLGFGLQFQSSVFGAFIVEVQVFDVSNTLLDTFQVAGTSNSIGDNSAIFWGVKSDTANIGRVRMVNSISNTTDDSFAINRLRLIGAANVPEPGMLALFGLGAAGLIAGRRRRTA